MTITAITTTTRFQAHRPRKTPRATLHQRSGMRCMDYLYLSIKYMSDIAAKTPANAPIAVPRAIMRVKGRFT